MRYAHGFDEVAIPVPIGVSEGTEIERRRHDLRVEAAAVLLGGEVYSLPSPKRHHDVVIMMYERGLDPRGEQGFLLSDGRFCTRRAAYLVAEQAGQLLPRQPGGYDGLELYSEDLW